MIRNYILPITGTVTDWHYFSGDPADPVEIVGFEYFVGQIFNYDVVSTEKEQTTHRVVEFLPKQGLAEIQVTATKTFHEELTVWIDGFENPADLCSHISKPHTTPPDELYDECKDCVEIGYTV